MKFLRFAAPCLILLAGFLPARADELILNNGSKLIGTIKEKKDDTLIVETPFAGDVKVLLKELRGLNTHRVIHVELIDGSRAAGTAAFGDDGRTTLRAEGGEARAINLADLKYLWAAGDPDPAEAEAELAAKKAAGIWTAKLVLGLSGQTGNNEKLSLYSQFEALRTRNDNERLKFYARGIFSEDNGVRSKNEIIGGVLLERDVDDRNFWYVRNEMEFDEFEQIDFRLTSTAGAGRFFIKEKNEELKLRGGIGYQHENYDSGAPDIRDDAVIAEVGLDYMKKVEPWLLFKHSTVYYPTLERASDFRISSDNNLEIPIANDQDIKLRLGVRFEYNAQPAVGVDRLDTYYYTTVVFDLTP